MVCPVGCVALYNDNCVPPTPPPCLLKSGIYSEQVFWRWHKAEIKLRKQGRLTADQLIAWHMRGAWLAKNQTLATVTTFQPKANSGWSQLPVASGNMVLVSRKMLAVVQTGFIIFREAVTSGCVWSQISDEVDKDAFPLRFPVIWVSLVKLFLGVVSFWDAKHGGLAQWESRMQRP